MQRKSVHRIQALVTALIALAVLEGSARLMMKVILNFRGVSYLPISKKSLTAAQEERIRLLLQKKNRYFTIDSLTGWTILPGGRAAPYRANAQGMRGDREYDSLPPDNKHRVAAFGNSFTHCDQVSNSQTWQSVMESRDSGLEVLNFGVSGYGLDQAYLRYRQLGIQFNPATVFICFMPENIHRNVSVFRPFYMAGTTMPLAKPRYKLMDSALVLLPNPLPSRADYMTLLNNPVPVLKTLSVHDYHFHRNYGSQIWDIFRTVRLSKMLVHRVLQTENTMRLDGGFNENSEAFRITTALFRDFYTEVVKNGCRPVIVVLASYSDLLKKQRQKPMRYAPLKAYFENAGFLYWENIEAFYGQKRQYREEELIQGHYTPLGNRLTAEYLLKKLKTLNSGKAGTNRNNGPMAGISDY